MAEKFISYTAHGVGESTLIRSTKVGHHYNLVADVDIDNGSVCKLGDYAVDADNNRVADLWKADIPAVGDKIVFILTAPKIYADYTPLMQEEKNFYNGAGDAMRGYEIVDTDRFTLSAEAFSKDAAPAVGEYVVVDGTGYKLTTAGTTMPSGKTYGFIGYIYAIANNGNYRIIVKKNEQIWA